MTGMTTNKEYLSQRLISLLGQLGTSPSYDHCDIWVQLYVSQVYLSLFPVFLFSLLCYQFFGE